MVTIQPYGLGSTMQDTTLTLSLEIDDPIA